jgi:hypothetical protein
MYTVETTIIGPRHVLADIIKDNENIALTLEMYPYFFYKNMRKNFTDVNVPVFVSMKYNSAVCSTEFVTCVELHDKFKEAIANLCLIEYWNAMILPIPSKELYDLYIDNREFIDNMEDCLILNNEESLDMLNSWEVKNTLKIDTNKYYITILKKSKMDLYKNGEWWTDEERYTNETT